MVAGVVVAAVRLLSQAGLSVIQREGSLTQDTGAILQICCRCSKGCNLLEADCAHCQRIVLAVVVGSASGMTAGRCMPCMAAGEVMATVGCCHQAVSKDRIIYSERPYWLLE